MSAKKWFFIFLSTCLLLALLVMAVNVLVDPFGVFGDSLFDWYSFNETNNPRVAKTVYLEREHDSYDSYIIGASSSSSFPVETANEYFGGSFFNLFGYGSDIQDAEQNCEYILENYEVKNIILCFYLSGAENYGYESDPLTGSMHQLVSGESKLSFYTRYLFANLNYSISKISSSIKDTYLSQSFDVFNPQTGAYDKLARDTEPINSLGEYVAKDQYSIFSNYPHYPHTLAAADACLKGIAHIRDMCEEAGVTLTVICAPVYHEDFVNYDMAEVTEFFTRLADITPYWDFTMSSISFDARYFYDATHLRNDVGSMALARVAGDGSVYIHEDFGTYVTPENAAEHVLSLWDTEATHESDYTSELSVIMYHSFTDEGGDDLNVTPERFAEQLDALADAGYTTVSLVELVDYVNCGGELPEKPLLITFDDGYLTNYEYAWPILAERGMKAVIFSVGTTMGSDTYKDTGQAINPHFTIEQANEMISSGVIEIGSHTYDMHQAAQYESGVVRDTVLPLAGESEEDYIETLRADIAAYDELIASKLVSPVLAFSYPHGDFTALSEAILHESGIAVTVTTTNGINTVIRGLPQSLLQLYRYAVSGEQTGAEVVEMISK